MRSEYWTRSSAFDPETIGAINCITSKAIQETSVALAKGMSQLDISDEERAYAIHTVTEQIAKGIADAIKQWQDDRRQPRRAK
jgi:hypothetical protein